MRGISADVRGSRDEIAYIYDRSDSYRLCYEILNDQCCLRRQSIDREAPADGLSLDQPILEQLLQPPFDEPIGRVQFGYRIRYYWLLEGFDRIMDSVAGELP